MLKLRLLLVYVLDGLLGLIVRRRRLQDLRNLGCCLALALRQCSSYHIHVHEQALYPAQTSYSTWIFEASVSLFMRRRSGGSTTTNPGAGIDYLRVVTAAYIEDHTEMHLRDLLPFTSISHVVLRRDKPSTARLN